MKVEINIQPLGKGYAGVPTYIRNLIVELTRSYPDIELRYAADHFVDALPREAQSRLLPAVSDLKTLLLWENMRYPLHTTVARPDIVHIPYHASTLWSGGRRVITVHDCFLWSNPPVKRTELIYRSLLERAARNAHIVITDSDYSRRMIHELFDIGHDRIVVTPLACSPDIAVPRSPHELATFGARAGIERPYIFYAGGTAAHKGVATLVEAYAMLHPDLRAAYDLVIAGRLDGEIPHHRAIHAAIAGISGPGRVVIPGIIPQEDLGTAYQGASVFVFPSFYEGFGLSPLEAMQCGIPVIASNRTSIPEVVGDAGILIDPADTGSITRALDTVLRSPDRRIEMRQASLAQAGQFSWARTAALTVDAYRAALA